MLTEDVPRRAPRKPRATPGAKAGARPTSGRSLRLPPWASRLTQRPLRTICGATFAAVITGIIVNALVLQRGPHPAPLFTRASDMARTVSVPVPPSRPAEFAGSTSDTPTAAIPAPVPAPAPSRPAASPRDSGDPLAALIKANGSSSTATPADAERVSAMQRALIKLNLAPKDSKVDGIMGSTTRQAIEKFERKNNLPVTGEPSSKIVRLLATQSGIAIP
jgi:hypothetical protein